MSYTLTKCLLADIRDTENMTPEDRVSFIISSLKARGFVTEEEE